MLAGPLHAVWGLVVAGVLAATLANPGWAQRAPVAAFLGENGDTWILESTGQVRYLSALPTVAYQGLAIDPSGTTVVTTRPQGGLTELVLIAIADGRVQSVPSTRDRNC